MGKSISKSDLRNSKKIVGDDVKIIKSKTDDNRSYHISSEKLKVLNFKTKAIEDAVKDLSNKFREKF